MATAMISALGCLGDAGAETDHWFAFSEHETLLQAHRILLASEAAAVHLGLGEAKPPAYPPRIAQLLEDGNKTRAIDFVQACAARNKYRTSMDDFLKAVDCLATPAALGAAPDPSTTGDPAFNSPWSLLGLPTVSFPIGLSADGLPLAVQLVGRARFDLHLLRTAEWCETVIRSANRGS